MRYLLRLVALSGALALAAALVQQPMQPYVLPALTEEDWMPSRLLPERELSAGETNPGRIPAQYAEALAQAAAGGREADARALAAEAYELFWEPVARVSPLPRSLDRPTRLPGGAPGPNFYSSTLGGAWLAAELLGQYQRDRDGSSEYLATVRRFADAMLEHGRDRYGEKQGDMFACLLLIQEKPALPDVAFSNEQPGPVNFPHIYGSMMNGGGPQRMCWRGENPIHSQHLYLLLDALSAETGDAKYAAAAKAALADWAARGLVPDTGLYAWGEHAQFDFRSDSWFEGVPGAEEPWGFDFRMHELSEVDPRLLRALWEADPAGLQRYALAIVDAHTLGLPCPYAFAYDRHGALWAGPRSAAPGCCHAVPRQAALWFDLWGHLMEWTGDAEFKQQLEERWMQVVEGLKQLAFRFGLHGRDVAGHLSADGTRHAAYGDVREAEPAGAGGATELREAAARWAERLPGRLAARLDVLAEGQHLLFDAHRDAVLPTREPAHLKAARLGLAPQEVLDDE